MFSNTLQSAMPFTILLCLSVSFGLFGNVDGRRRTSNRMESEGTCERIRLNSPDYLHFRMQTSSGHEIGNTYGSSKKSSDSKPTKEQSSKSKSKENISNRIGISEEITGFQPTQEQDIADKCIKVPTCDREAKYRTINGSCNNFKFPMWGVANSALVRLLPANYQDGVNKIRKSKTGKELPNVRQLSTSLFPDKHVPDNLNMYIVMQWGQLVAHDTAHIVQQDSESLGIDCCSMSRSSCQEACLPIAVPENDPFYSKYKQTCLNMVRSVTTTNLGCELSPQQQIAAVTHFLDASFVYGSTERVAKALRSFKNGLLEVQLASDKREFPPNSDNAKSDCDNKGKDNVCYATGDDRANQNTGMTVLQIIFLREHNRLCRELKKINPHWNDEKLYQEARRIVGAEVQRITYHTFLPIILGTEYLKEHDLIDGHEDEPFSKGYDEFLNPSTLNEFTAAAYRAFHSMIPREVMLFDNRFNKIKTINLDDFYFRPTIIQKPGMLDKFLRGLAVQSAETQDTFFSETITKYLFKSDKPFGKDLESIDMQRGRDHGLPVYNDLRKVCGRRSAANFIDLIDVMSEESLKLLASKYEHVDDIDLFVGGMLEQRAPGALIGPTFQCIIGEQFKRWRNGDYFYYDFGNHTGSFTPDQVREIRKITLAEIFCLNGDDIEKLTIDVFRGSGVLNPFKSCKKIIKMDLTPWKETDIEVVVV